MAVSVRQHVCLSMTMSVSPCARAPSVESWTENCPPNTVVCAFKTKSWRHALNQWTALNRRLHTRTVNWSLALYLRWRFLTKHCCSSTLLDNQDRCCSIPSHHLATRRGALTAKKYIVFFSNAPSTPIFLSTHSLAKGDGAMERIVEQMGGFQLYVHATSLGQSTGVSCCLVYRGHTYTQY